MNAVNPSESKKKVDPQTIEKKTPAPSDDHGSEIAFEDHPFTERQWWKMCDFNMSLPVPLAKAEAGKPFVYDRKWGLFYVPTGMHSSAASLLLSFHHNLHNGIDVSEKLNLRYSGGTFEHWLAEIPGTAFLSSVGKAVYMGRPDNLSVMEKRLLRRLSPTGEVASLKQFSNGGPK